MRDGVIGGIGASDGGGVGDGAGVGAGGIDKSALYKKCAEIIERIS